MALQTRIFTRHVETADRHQLAHLIHFGTYVHRHLDWKPPLEWIGKSPFFVAETNERVVSALACPPDPPGIAWVRIFVCSTQTPYGYAWEHLWEQTKKFFESNKVKMVAAIPLQKWFRQLLSDHDFVHNHNVIALAWDYAPGRIDTLPPPKRFNIRRMTNHDLDQVHEVDSHSFGQLWRNASDSIRLAFQQALYATVIEDEENILGYQITTNTPYGAHLGRLATSQHFQNKGIGYALLHDLVKQLSTQRIPRISVNTQDHNTVSRNLYRKVGFFETDEAYPIFQYSFD